jgi:hypothetical protein
MDFRVIARYRLRDAARDLEEIGVLLQEAGHLAIPGELQRMSERLLQLRQTVGRDGGGSPPGEAVSP